jgi:uncharacterized protein (DUF927 family)
MAYSLANGQGKGTMTREREGRAKLSWRLLALSSGERSSLTRPYPAMLPMLALSCAWST